MTQRSVLVAHPSSDLYGSDLQLVESVRGMVEADLRVQVAVQSDGPLVALLEEAGAEVSILAFPVLRKSLLSARGLLGLVLTLLPQVLKIVGFARSRKPSLVYVNTLTLPHWMLACALLRVPVVAHVHEAEGDQPRAVRFLLTSPLLLAKRIVTNSVAATNVILDSHPRLASRLVVVYNGVPQPDLTKPVSDPRRGQVELLLVGRISPRKGTDVAVRALALLRDQGIDARLTLAGNVFPGYEWYENELRDLVTDAHLTQDVDFLGYVSPTGPLLEAADVVLVPSRQEPFGNAAVEALLARRPLVASEVQGLAEVVRHGTTGILVPPDSPSALAEAIKSLVEDPVLALSLATAGEKDAISRFSTQRFRKDIAAIIEQVIAA